MTKKERGGGTNMRSHGSDGDGRVWQSLGKSQHYACSQLQYYKLTLQVSVCRQ